MHDLFTADMFFLVIISLAVIVVSLAWLAAAVSVILAAREIRQLVRHAREGVERMEYEVGKARHLLLLPVRVIVRLLRAYAKR